VRCGNDDGGKAAAGSINAIYWRRRKEGRMAGIYMRGV
jgi:hypothetical protein